MTIGKNTDTSAFDSTLMARSPYYDDFDPEKKFLKVLFRPGQNVQARELSTLQSILQNQIERVITSSKTVLLLAVVKSLYSMAFLLALQPTLLCPLKI